MNPDQLVRLARVRRLARSGEARRLRKEAGLRQTEIAQAIDLDPVELCRWETGRRAPHGMAALLWLDLLLDLGAAERVAS